MRAIAIILSSCSVAIGCGSEVSHEDGADERIIEVKEALGTAGRPSTLTKKEGNLTSTSEQDRENNTFNENVLLNVSPYYGEMYRAFPCAPPTPCGNSTIHTAVPTL